MTHQNHQTNGASLEDCHTNFFALTELYGIKWRKFVWGESPGGGGVGGDSEIAAPLADPVISSYARCLAGDILCVWRRVPAPQPPQDLYDMSVPPPPAPPPLSLRAAKELWIFWYGEEPDLNGLVAPELLAIQGEQGSWEIGLSYECRSLLFKALHNLIERCLLSRDFVRLGKWFVQPYDGDEDDVDKSPWHLSFSFAFFLHGESTVCASVDVRQHPPVRTLTARRLARVARLAPAAAASLAPDHHADANVILAPFGLEGAVTGREWGDGDAVTARLLDAWRQLYPLEQGCGAVEVVCGGVRMRYPAPYVLVAELRRAAAAPAAGEGAAAALAERSVRALAHPHPQPHPQSQPQPQPQAMEVCNGELEKPECDFIDPSRKSTCTCAKWRRARRPRPARAARPAPFHRRHPALHPHPPTHTHKAAPGGASSPGSCGGGSPAAPGSAPASAGPPPPSPPAPAPAAAALAAHAPHHPAAAAHAPLQSQCVSTALHTPAPTPDPHAPSTPAPPSHNTRHQGGESPAGGGPAGGAGAGDSLLKRPQLPAPERRHDPLEDEQSLRMLYDYTSVHAWLEHPVKRFKSSGPCWREEASVWGAAGAGDLYAGHHHTKMAAAVVDRGRDPLALALALVDVKVEKQDANEDIKEYKNLFTSDGLCPTIKDLDQIFDNSDDAGSGDETLQVQTPPDSNKSSEEVRCGAGGGGRGVRAEELSKMFPTPPSMEAHAQPSPGFTLADDAAPHHAHAHAHALAHRHAHHAAAGSPQPDAIEDWSFVFKPPTVCKYVGSSKYAPLATLPSQLLPPVSLPSQAVYRPRWQQDKQTHPTKRAAAASPRSETPLAAALSAGTASRASTPAPPGPSPAPRAPPQPSPAPREPPPPAHACPLLLNVLLADTVLNVFRDHNFDSCTLCVCNAEAKVVGNIRGADAATYLPSAAALASLASPSQSPAASPAPPAPADDDPVRCTCGFSAVLNRRLAHRAGLFYEDEMEITGIAEDPGPAGAGRGRAGGPGVGDVAEVVLAQCAALGGSASALARAALAAAAPRADELRLNLLEYLDGGDAAALALRAAAAPAPRAPAAAASLPPRVHRWAFIGARGPRSSRDVVRLMKRLRPLLQDAIQKRCCGARMWDGVSGPLTWRQFHRLAGRGNEDLCEPQPVPPILVGHDRDWVSLSPYALRHWERLSLEPYSYSRDVAYVVLAPDAEALTEPLRTFFRELSTVYESCRLGRHAPLARLAPDGLVRVAGAPGAADADDWLGEVPAGGLGECIRAYSDKLRTKLVPQLASLTLDHSLFESETGKTGPAHAERPTPSPMRPPSTPDHPPTPNSQSDQENDTSLNNSNSSVGSVGAANGVGAGAAAGAGGAEAEGGAPLLVVYVVEPPGAHAQPAACLHALLRLAAKTGAKLHHHNPLVKIVSLEGVWAMSSAGVGVGAGAGGGGASGGGGELRALAFSVFTGARRLMAHSANGKSLTGFGTAANAALFLKAKDEKNRAPYKLFSPAYVLAPPKALLRDGGAGAGGAREAAGEWGWTLGEAGEQAGVLFLAYCLSHDQRWLLAAATDARGELLDTALIDIHVPARSRRRRAAPARRLGLTKLMDFILGVMSQSAQPWRLVVGRVGRIGHGELKGWSWLLSRKNLTRASSFLREICGSCSVLYPHGVPCILSACLVSTEPDSCLRLMADRFTPDERFSQASIASHLHTPRDVTATHILVFPTSATTQSNQLPFEPPMANGEADDMMFLGVDMGDEEMSEDNMTDLLIGDMFNNMWAPNSPRRPDDEPGGSRDGSPARAPPGQPPYHHAIDTNSEQVGTVLQQPLALGYLVSTAPLGGMPAWWWAGCAHLRGACPAFLKNALHLHAAAVQVADDFTTLTHHRDHQHPLDSQTTTDVLRYVLEGYNALSWLALDGATHDRASCLPIHVQVLMQLYHTAAALG